MQQIGAPIPCLRTSLEGPMNSKTDFMRHRYVKVSQWVCNTGNAATVAHSTKKTTSVKDSVIEGQPLLLFMLWAGD
jgi:hypothetical protein